MVTILFRISLYFTSILFALAGIYKIVKLQSLVTSLQFFDFIPVTVYRFLLLFVASLEITTAFFLFIKRYQALGALLGITLSAVFFLYRLIGFLLDFQGDCGCLPFIQTFKFDLYGLGMNMVLLAFMVTLFTNIRLETNAKSIIQS